MDSIASVNITRDDFLSTFRIRNLVILPFSTLFNSFKDGRNYETATEAHPCTDPIL